MLPLGRQVAAVEKAMLARAAQPRSPTRAPAHAPAHAQPRSPTHAPAHAQLKSHAQGQEGTGIGM